MSILPGATYSAPDELLYAEFGSGGGGTNVSTFTQLYTSSIGTANPVSNDLAIIGFSGINNIVFDLTEPTLSQILIQPSTVTGSGIAGGIVNVTDLGANNYIMYVGGSSGVSSCLVNIPNIGCDTAQISTLNVSSINSAPATKAWFGTGEIGNIVAGVSEEVLPFSFSSIDSFCATANYSYNNPPTTALSSLYTYPSTVSSFLLRGQDTFAYAWTVVGV